jgi:hypothetical protein
MENEKEFDGWMIPLSMVTNIQEILKPGDIILEFGTGYGTIELLRNFNVISIEHDKAWAVAKAGKYNHVMIYAPLKKHKTKGWDDEVWYDMKVIERCLQSFDYDAIIIDGPTGINGRAGIVDYFPKLKQDVPVFMDDIHKPEYMKIFKAISGKRRKEVVKVNWWKGIERKFGIIK